MKNIKLKPTQKFLVLNKDILVIHNDAKIKLIWLIRLLMLGVAEMVFHLGYPKQCR